MSDESGELDEPCLWFRASSKGNGIGLTVVHGRRINGRTDTWLSIYVLPKLWREDEDRTGLSNTFALSSADLLLQHTVICLYEMDTLGLPAELAWALRGTTTSADDVPGGATALNALRVNDAGDDPLEEREEGAGDPLWEEVLPTEGTPLAVLHPEARTIDGFWKLIEDEVRPTFDSPPPGTNLLLRDPFVRRFYLRLFLESAHEQIARRRPNFSTTRDPLGAIRGRVLIPELIKRTAHRTLPIWCEYDSLSSDTHMWQAIRKAVTICAREIQDDQRLLSTALDCDARLSDVSMESVAEILARESTVWPTIRDRRLGRLYLAALAIIRDDALLARPATEDADGVVFAFKVVTSDVWERLVSQAIDSTGSHVSERRPKSRSLFRNAPGKTVDITVRQVTGAQSGPALLLDAKYKSAKSAVTSATMSDQYQIYAYANLWEAPAFLVFPARNEVSPRVRASLAEKNRGRQVGVLHLPFPAPGQAFVPADPAAITAMVREAIGREPQSTVTDALRTAWPAGGGYLRVSERRN